MNNCIFDCVQALNTSLEQDDVLSRDIILTIIANMVRCVSDDNCPLNDRIPPLTKLEVEFSISEMDDLNGISHDDFSYFNYFQFSRRVLILRMYRKDSYNHLVQFELPESGKLTFLSDEQMSSLLHYQTVKCIFKLYIPDEVKILFTEAVKNSSRRYQKIKQMIQDIQTYEHDLNMELAEIQLSPEWSSSKWKYRLHLWIPTKDGESDSLCTSYEFKELDVLQELFGKEFVLIRTISRIDFKFRLDTTA